MPPDCTSPGRCWGSNQSLTLRSCRALVWRRSACRNRNGRPRNSSIVRTPADAKSCARHCTAQKAGSGKVINKEENEETERAHRNRKARPKFPDGPLVKVQTLFSAGDLRHHHVSHHHRHYGTRLRHHRHASCRHRRSYRHHHVSHLRHRSSRHHGTRHHRSYHHRESRLLRRNFLRRRSCGSAQSRNETALGSCGWAENTSVAQNCAAASKKAAGHSRDSHRTGNSSCAAEARRSARCWNNSAGYCCSSAWKAARASCCRRAVPHRLPTADDHSSLEPNSAPAHSSGGSSCRTPVARVPGRLDCLALPRSASCFPRAVRNCCPRGCLWIGLNSASPKAADSPRADAVAASWPSCLARSRNVRPCSMSHSNWASPKVGSATAMGPNCLAHFRNVRWCSMSDSNSALPKEDDFGRVRVAGQSFPNWLERCSVD